MLITHVFVPSALCYYGNEFDSLCAEAPMRCDARVHFEREKNELDSIESTFVEIKRFPVRAYTCVYNNILQPKNKIIFSPAVTFRLVSPAVIIVR